MNRLSFDDFISIRRQIVDQLVWLIEDCTENPDICWSGDRQMYIAKGIVRALDTLHYLDDDMVSDKFALLLYDLQDNTKYGKDTEQVRKDIVELLDNHILKEEENNK